MSRVTFNALHVIIELRSIHLDPGGVSTQLLRICLMRNRLLPVTLLFTVGHRKNANTLISFASRFAGQKRNEGSASGGEYSQVIGSPVDSANGSNSYDGVDGGGGGNDDESAPIDSRNVSGSDDDAGSYFDAEGSGDDDDDDDDDDGDGDGSVCTRDEELSVPDDEDQSGSGYDSRSLSPSSGGSWGKGRPLVPPLDLR